MNIDTIAVWLVLLVMYFLPTIVADSRKHNNNKTILIINLFFGWTILGWILTLAWAFSGNVQKKEVCHD